jgi:Protein of unknown function (DUF3501)
MKPLALDDMLDIDAYEAQRDAYRPRVTALKRIRRLAVGDRVTLVFENRETIRFQVQEMMRVEHIREPAKIQRELDVYNELIPGDGELSATLLIEITEMDRIRSELDRLIGLDEHVSLVLGAGERARLVPARFDPKQFEADRIAAVQYLKFPIDAAAAALLRNPSAPAAVRIDHPSYRCEIAMSDEVRRSLIADLAGDSEPLLRSPRSVPAAAEAVLEAEGRVRVVRAFRPAGPGHVVIEPIEPVASLLDADDGLALELLAAIRRHARAVLERHGSCRVTTDLHAPRLRWHVFAPGS